MKPGMDDQYRTIDAETYAGAGGMDMENYDHRNRMTCPRCKDYVQPGAKYCMNCGYRFPKKSGSSNTVLLLIIFGLLLILLAVIAGILLGWFGGDDSVSETGAESTAVVETTPTAEAQQSAAAVTMGNVTGVTATSSRSPEYGNSYDPRLILDSDVRTAWVEGVSGQGVGEGITLQLSGSALVTGFDLTSGYQKTSALFYKNSRPETILVTFSDGTSETISLRDAMGTQHILFSQPVETSEISIRIQSVYPGSDYTDTAISEIVLF